MIQILSRFFPSLDPSDGPKVSNGPGRILTHRMLVKGRYLLPVWQPPLRQYLRLRPFALEPVGSGSTRVAVASRNALGSAVAQLSLSQYDRGIPRSFKNQTNAIVGRGILRAVSLGGSVRLISLVSVAIIRSDLVLIFS